MKLVIDGKPVDSPLGPQDRYGDPAALGRMATSASLPETKLPPTAAEVRSDPAEPRSVPDVRAGAAEPRQHLRHDRQPRAARLLRRGGLSRGHHPGPR